MIIKVILDFELHIVRAAFFGKIEHKHYQHFADSCRRRMGPEWIEILDIRQAVSNMSYKELEQLAEQSFTLQQEVPIQALIVHENTDFKYGQIRVFETLRDMKSDTFTFHLVRSDEELAKAIAEVRGEILDIDKYEEM